MEIVSFKTENIIAVSAADIQAQSAFGILDISNTAVSY